MKQTNLLSYFNNKSTSTNNIKESVHTYFYLHWNDKKPKVQAQFFKEKPKLINFKHTFVWNNTEIILCGYFDFLINQDDNDIFKPEKEKKYKNIGFLKSLLQKAIRRGNIDVAVKCAYHYILLDLQDFLRRLSIIIIEDTSLHEVYSTVVWLMVASNSKECAILFEKVIYEYLMGVVYVIAKSSLYHSLSDNEEFKFDILKEEVHKKGEPLKSLIYSLMIRKAYGGMKCDLHMLEKYAHIWNHLNIESKYLNKSIVRPIMLESISQLQLNEWIVEAIDFHCAPQILTYVHEEYEEFSEEYIKSLIWNYSSKKNIRIKEENIPKDIDPSDWNKIKVYVKRVQNYLLEENY
jgi:hypothetical protein